MSFYFSKKIVKLKYLLYAIFLLFLFIFIYFFFSRDNKSDNYKSYILNSSISCSKINDEVLNPQKLYARNALLMDASNHRVLYEKSGYDKVPMASTTKIMTLLIAIENGNLNDLVKVSKYAASMPNVQLGINEGEEYRLNDLLYSLMLESHNDVAVAIAEHIGGSVENFAFLMNKKAKELGAFNTNFVTPNGLDASDHYTTAFDLGVITSYAIQNNKFCEIINEKSYSFHEQKKGRVFTVNNKNRFLNMYKDAIGVKTGFTGNAGYCFVGAIKQSDKCFVSVVLGCGWPPHKNYKWKDTRKLMDYGLQNFHRKEIVKKGTSFQKIKVEQSIGNISVTPYVKKSIDLLLKSNEVVTFEIKVPQILTAPLKKEEVIGKLIIKIDGKNYKILPLHSKEEAKLVTYRYWLEKIIKKYFLGI